MKKAILLYNSGYCALMFDFRARGESGGSLCTIGKRETDDLLSAVKWATQNPTLAGLRIGVLGDSMGAFVAIMSVSRCKSIEAVVAESPFDRLDHAIENHFSSVFGKASPLIGVPVQWVCEKITGSKSVSISPIDEIQGISFRPILIISDDEDDLSPPAMLEALYSWAGNLKTLWSVPKADPIEALEVASEEYKKRVVDFFDKNLKKPVH